MDDLLLVAVLIAMYVGPLVLGGVMLAILLAPIFWVASLFLGR